MTGYADVTDCGGVAAATWPRLPTETNFSHRICHAAPATGSDASGSLYIRVICAVGGEYLRGIIAAIPGRAFGKNGLEPFLELGVPEPTSNGGERLVVVVTEGSGHKRVAVLPPHQ